MATWPVDKTADLLGISERHLRRLVAEGIVPAKASGFDPLEAARAYIRHISRDLAGRQARTELAKTAAAAKRLHMKRQLGEMLTLHELTDLSSDLWGGAWSAWTLAASWFYHALPASLPESERLRIAGTADQNGKSELIALRERWAARLHGAKVSLHDEARIDALLGKLTEADPEPGEGEPDA